MVKKLRLFARKYGEQERTPGVLGERLRLGDERFTVALVVDGHDAEHVAVLRLQPRYAALQVLHLRRNTGKISHEKRPRDDPLTSSRKGTRSQFM